MFCKTISLTSLVVGLHVLMLQLPGSDESTTTTTGPTDTGLRGREYTTGIALLQEGKFKDAAEKFRAAFVSTRLEAYEEMSGASKTASTGTAYLRDGKFAEAASIFQEAHDATPFSTVATSVFVKCRDASLLAIRGHVFLKQGNFHEAIETFRSAREKAKNLVALRATFDNCISAITIASVGKTLLVDGNFKESTEIFQRAYEKSKVDEVSLTLMNLKKQSGLAWKGVSFIKQLKCFDNASKSFQEAYEISTIPSFYFTFARFRDAANLAKQGSEFLKLGQFSQALAEFHEAINKSHAEIFSSYVNVTKSAIKGYDLLREGKALEASEHFQNALLVRDTVFPGDVAVLVNCRDVLAVAAEGQTLLTQRKFHEALIKFQEAFSKSAVREVRYLLSRLKKLPYEGGVYCSHDDFFAVESE